MASTSPPTGRRSPDGSLPAMFRGKIVVFPLMLIYIAPRYRVFWAGLYDSRALLVAMHRSRVAATLILPATGGDA